MKVSIETSGCPRFPVEAVISYFFKEKSCLWEKIERTKGFTLLICTIRETTKLLGKVPILKRRFLSSIIKKIQKN